MGTVQAAIAHAVLDALARQGHHPHHVEGLPSGRWVLLDFVDFVVHLFHPEARAALEHVRGWGLVDAFRLHHEAPGLYSWWDYRALAFRRNQGLRIDLMLASGALSQSCRRAWIDKEPRGWERPSDHVPVVAEFTAP